MKAVIHAAMLGEKIDFDRKRVNITFTNRNENNTEM